MKHTRARCLYVALCILLCVGMFVSLWYTVISPTSPYSFDPTDKENFVLKDTDAFRALLPKGVTRIVFTDRLSPYGAELTELSERGEGGVVGWKEADAYMISTRTKGQRVILNAESASLFAGLTALRTVDLSMVDTSRVTDFRRFFYNCTSLQEADVSVLSFENAICTRSMFMNCYSLESVTLGNAKTDKLLDVGFMFSATRSLLSVDLSGWDLSGVLCSTAMLQSCGASRILLPDSLTTLGSFFYNHAASYEGEVYTVPKGVTTFGGAHLFYNFGTDAFSAFSVAEGNTALKAIDGVLYSADGSKLLALPKGKTFENGVFEIPEGVTLLGELCFSRNGHVKTVLLPNSYRVSVYTEPDHPDFADYAGSGNKNIGNSLHLATYTYTDVKAFAVHADNPIYTAKDGALYEKGEAGEGASLVAVPLGYAGTLALPEGVRTWQDGALWQIEDADYAALTAIRIPASLSEIAPLQIEKINALAATVTVDAENSVYTVNAEGKLVLK